MTESRKFICPCGKVYKDRLELFTHVQTCPKFIELDKDGQARWYTTYRKSSEIEDAILKVIENNGGWADTKVLYKRIPDYVDILQFEYAQSGVNKEQLWRGRVRGVWLKMVKDGKLKQDGNTQDVIYTLPSKKKYVRYIPPGMTKLTSKIKR